MERDLPDLIGAAPAFAAMLDHASRVAPLERPVLVIGERGVGKELIASRLHFLSQRWDQPLITVNCAALSEDLLESELFGHEAGAFTGAARRHVGRFERADGGSLFLDEIAAASLRVQEKLLRVIEYQEFERLGGDRTLRADVR
ncbi:MAG: sigma 54-interacting transcriptional regulator, partial [Geminicoccaceae bacterium]